MAEPRRAQFHQINAAAGHLSQSTSTVSIVTNPACLSASNSSVGFLQPLDFSRTVKTRQYAAALCASMAATGVGTILGYSSPVLDQIERPTSAESWIASLLHLGAFFGGIVGGSLNVMFGKRMTLIMVMAPFLIGTALLIGAANDAMFYIGRLLCGIACGVTCVTAPTYIAEIAEPSIRGMLCSWFQLFVTIGILATSVVGIWSPWRAIGVFCAVFPTLAIAAMLFVAKESPTDCVIKSQIAQDKGQTSLASGKRAQARNSLVWLRGDEHDVDRELREIEESVLRTRATAFALLADVKKPGFYKPLIVCLGLMVFHQMSGINAVIAYAKSIFESSGSSLSPDAATVLVMATQVLATLLAAFIVDRAGRKPLLYVSCILEVVSLVLLGVFFYVKEGKEDLELADKLGALPAVSLIVFIFAFSIGYGPLPWVFMGELFGDESRAAASSIATAVTWLLAFTVTRTFPDLVEVMGSYGAFWFFAAFTSLSVPFLFFLTPETKGKSLEDIQKLFSL